jgi:hypothetical protein
MAIAYLTAHNGVLSRSHRVPVSGRGGLSVCEGMGIRVRIQESRNIEVRMLGDITKHWWLISHFERSCDDRFRGFGLENRPTCLVSKRCKVEGGSFEGGAAGFCSGPRMQEVK